MSYVNSQQISVQKVAWHRAQSEHRRCFGAAGDVHYRRRGCAGPRRVRRPVRYRSQADDAALPSEVFAIESAAGVRQHMAGQGRGRSAAASAG